ncbi:MAG: glycoside hydrolase family 73 protein [Phocaeicola sp.]
MTADEFVAWIYPIAERTSDINPVFVVAQAALESGWGKSKVGEYNLFGITKGSYTGKCLLVTTTEIFDTPNKKFTAPEEVLSVTPTGNGKYRYKVKRLFRDYSSMEECLADYFEIFRKPHFQHAWPYRKSPEEFVKKIQSGKMKYATDPNYVETMIQMFKSVRRRL